MKLAAFQLVNSRVVIGRIDEKLLNLAGPELPISVPVHGPYEFAFVRGAGNTPQPAMMPYTVIPHVGTAVELLSLRAIHVVAWEYTTKDIETLYTRVTSGIQVASVAPTAPNPKLEIVKN